MPGHLLVTAVQYHFIAVVGNGSRLGIIRNQQPGDAAEVGIGVDMAEKPILLLHVIDFLYSRLLSKQSVDVFQGFSYKQLAANVADKSA